MSDWFPSGLGAAQGDPLAVAAGYKSWNFHPAACSTSATPASQTIYAVAVYLPFGKTISTLSLMTLVAGSGTTPTGFFVGLASPTKMLAQSANLNGSASLTTIGLRDYALSTSYTASAADSSTGYFYVVLLKNGVFGTTDVKFGEGNGTGNIYNGGPPTGPLFGTIATGQTALPANGAAITVTAASFSFWTAAR